MDRRIFEPPWGVSLVEIRAGHPNIARFFEPPLNVTDFVSFSSPLTFLILILIVTVRTLKG